MATFPAYVRFSWQDSGEARQPVVERSPMERGVAKQRRTQADVVVTVPMTLYFSTEAAAADFETWFYSPAGANAGMGWFDFTLPRTGVVVQARIIGGDIGTLKPSNKTWSKTECQVKLEYVKVAL